MKFTFIDAEKATWPVAVQCRVLGVSKAGYYAWKRRPESNRARRDRQLAVLVRASHERGRRVYGSPRVHADLASQGVKVSRKRVIRLMRQQGLRGVGRRRFVKTTDSTETKTPAPNVLNQDFTATAPNERWVGDVTYLRTPEGTLYLAAILDMFSRFVVGWAQLDE